jgi:iron complex outermembrane receptor protein
MVIKKILFFSGILLIFCSVAVSAEREIQDYTEISIEELMDIEITSASRQAQKLSQTALPVSVVTAEDIHYSGATNIYEALSFTPSIDVLQVNRNRYALGVRGLHETWSDRTLTMVNGRPADNPLFGGSEFLRLPLIMEDIKQIEVLRGPSGSAWGANAFNGAINIITKRPEESEGVLASTTFNHFGDNYEQLRWAESKDKWSWRISTGYEKQESSSAAITGEHFVSSDFGEFTSDDYRRNLTLDSEFYNKLSQNKTLSFGVGHSHSKVGDYGFFYYYPKEDGFMETTKAFTQIETEHNKDTKSVIEWNGTFTNNKWPSRLKYKSFENQLQGKLDFVPAEKHKTTIGANIKLTHIDQDIMDSRDFIIESEPEDSQTAGLFAVDRWQVTDRFKIETQFQGGWYSETQTDWAARVSGLYALNDEHTDILRISGAKSYRTPFAALRKLDTTRYSGNAKLTAGGSLDNEETYSLEAGYSKKLNSSATFRLDAYLQEYKDLIGYANTVAAPATYQAENIGGARAWGVESELTIRKEKYKFSLWYNFHRFGTTSEPEKLSNKQEVRAYLPAKHKAGVNMRFFLADDITANINYKYSSFTDGTQGPWGGNVAGYNRLDLTIAKEFNFNKAAGEFLIGVSDVFNETEQIVTDTGIASYMHETPGRTFFARLQFKF